MVKSRFSEDEDVVATSARNHKEADSSFDRSAVWAAKTHSQPSAVTDGDGGGSLDPIRVDLWDLFHGFDNWWLLRV